MFTDNSHREALDALLEDWTESEAKTKAAFIEYKDLLLSFEGLSLSFKGRPGVSFSLRAKHENQSERELFVLVDVVDDDPADRWLSVCFYADMINDADELGDWVPGGLMGEDACCFNLDEDDAEMRAYIKDRITDAYNSAKK
ncbi:hypothetical protein [Halodesulfovibrio marinisediminis]|uniref:Uncharacterized protein n=1 Tax=Halodesulfovibrio marinisediminis DSM 17456 TaxID=1121457 RepID=A0A1N6E2L2_9BACT|nr:hypothetical protein [Halodesulfovibrio marinisediminis]SIN77280.1 hypothetical protein SAMN02745161_0662 [Halodesulfovibrio marinisediminis DSM 17456]